MGSQPSPPSCINHRTPRTTVDAGFPMEGCPSSAAAEVRPNLKRLLSPALSQTPFIFVSGEPPHPYSHPTSP